MDNRLTIGHVLAAKVARIENENGATAPAPRSVATIAAEIRREWKTVYFGAVPYLDAMRSIDSVNDPYFAEDGRSIVLYFLSNATSWRGDTARRIKAELKALLK